MLAIRFAELGCTGKRETSMFQALFAGNGLTPWRLAPMPSSGVADGIACIDACLGVNDEIATASATNAAQRRTRDFDIGITSDLGVGVGVLGKTDSTTSVSP